MLEAVHANSRTMLEAGFAYSSKLSCEDQKGDDDDEDEDGEKKEDKEDKEEDEKSEESESEEAREGKLHDWINILVNDSLW